MSRNNPYSASRLNKFETAHQRSETARQCSKALELTRRFADERQALTSILKRSPTIKSMHEWMGKETISSFKPKRFSVERPTKERPESYPAKPTPGFIDRLLGRSAKIEQRFQEQCAQVDEANAAADRRYHESLAKWEAKRSKHEAMQAKAEIDAAEKVERTNQKIRNIQKAWQDGDATTVVQYVEAVLRMSDHPPPLKPRVELHYDRAAKLLLMDYRLPLPSDMPTTKTVRYNATAGEFSKTEISQKDSKALYEGMCYQVCLRTIRDTFRGDQPKNIDTIVFNGNVEMKSATTGKKSIETIMSILVGRDAIKGIDFRNVDPKSCFKSLKGVSASSLPALAAVAPVITFNKSDKRFIKAEDVALDEDGSVNLAAMGWEEFEHLVRQVFEKEFASRGGEVKITQSSADGGVDAIAFDPDPITGGKIIIQAKRYTRTVGVSAVRDLFGTTQSEGASKGILVTTSDFGPDAYQFVQGKPISLLNGGNLLHLLEKHGMRARIDIAQARKELGLSGRVSRKAQR